MQKADTEIEDYKKELLSIFFTQRRMIFWVTVIIFACSILIAFCWPPTYSASGTILVKGKKAQKSAVAIEKEAINRFPLTKEDLASEVEIIVSVDVIENTIKYLSLNKHLLTNKSFLKNKMITASMKKEVYKIKQSLKTKVVPVSNVIKITFYDKGPQDAKVILETLMNQYVSYRQHVFNPTQTEVFFSHQVDNFKEDLIRKSDELVALAENTKVSDPQKEIENNLLVKRDLALQLNVLKNEAVDKKLSLDHIGKSLKSKDMKFFSFIKDLSVNNLGGLSQQIQMLIVERGKVLKIYHPESDKVQAMNKQVDGLYATLLTEIKAYKDNLENQLLIANTKIEGIEKRIENIDNRNVEIRRQQIYINGKETEVKLLLTSYETFFNRREEVKISSSKDAPGLYSYVGILSKAFPSKGPVYPQKSFVIPLGLLVAFITGCSLGFLREYFDHTFKKPSDCERYVNLPVIFSIPK